jgi:uncharacterized protein (DUF488 family)
VERGGGRQSEGIAAVVIFTIGHSTHPIETFLEMLAAHQVEQVADVRTIPKSRHNPQFCGEALSQELARHGIGYVHLPGLGGLRHARKDSINTGWKNASFRGYADYMQTPQFDESLRELIALAQPRRTAIMCAEAVPWRCHRSLIADALLARGIAVEDIMSKTSRKQHTLTPFAKVEGEVVTYPGLI